ncbi:MAG: UDP-N-acetylglucosamine 1-carboxyvinyltransferase [Candidatus Lloydbacteria bacterium RIFCSPHIGHO2_02_FULL_54_17]|uniref:UDP-N-acetylglucosamine 1-carboxyvinyltransferase n=1 Tax=Candidatus Lloydbacteria bacterium RIFCSPHIGHO2_02_FULL_54_17 TaxID=1798664 RepID=A0A1G2DCQ5_9BACT|nr:MAG: UDP-N-acetylglucosamine 1-carboxyvinyltransferase [Candidatus Lloydbacteria bacterium RIFCSPHIGHO2_01_FULL_54_11]OGZ11414.1 MAG: UDP-N-acetylglucosamine 1-carboxyvinyltransferase [Candidatus Lloydbacteria bacterium RIFCSPHIGHO2_02_FULL_54_17]OGZ13708.1 MAG: UDP-N-acetylglucosamine 1-carboxyvinyltransferase [Candidatus Lloydbacteria bacterium RIFCSPLOWO2_01_FULL_54_18]
MSEHFVVKGFAGKRTLSGSISVRGAKNAALKGIAASILFRTPVSFTNVPEIEDVSRMLEIVRTMGGSASFNDHCAAVDASTLSETTITPEIAKRLRASIVLTGPVLARFGKAKFPHPGGCVIGERPIDLFIEGFEKMGARVKRSGKFYDIRAEGGVLRGAELFFRTQSVTGTETFMMAAVLAKGETVIKNAAMEPEIVWLAELLNASGARITGAGTPSVTIRGGKLLAAPKKPFHVIPDRIEAGSFLILGALAAKKLVVRDIVPEHLESLIELLEYTGAHLTRSASAITVFAPPKAKPFRPVSVRTHEYPGFPTDLQAPMMVYLTQGEGESMVFETIFEGRLNFTESLNRMGANITMMDPHRVLVKGATALRGRELESPDLRAGLAFVVAAVVADGTSEINNVYNIDRGYERVEERLRTIGVNIIRKGGEKKGSA